MNLVFVFFTPLPLSKKTYMAILIIVSIPRSFNLWNRVIREFIAINNPVLSND
jgi:hypothetical protein